MRGKRPSLSHYHSLNFRFYKSVSYTLSVYSFHFRWGYIYVVINPRGIENEGSDRFKVGGPFKVNVIGYFRTIFLSETVIDEPISQNRSKGHLFRDDPNHIRLDSLDRFYQTEKKYSNITSDPSVKDVDFFLDVLEMFQTWLAATREQLAEQKVQNEAHINEITNMLSMILL